LVGLMGAGKSSVGRRLAETLGRPFYDSDDEIEAAAGLSVTDIFELHGEEEFRRVERRVIERLLGEAPHVLGTGGGAYLNEETRALMKERAVTIWLDADLEVLWKRVSRRDGRPLLKADNPKQVLSDLLDARAPVYAEADIRIRSEEGPHTRAVDAILKALST
ncbi:MAG: shikimate kinase, partial [Pseudomonadota bacterium]